MITSLSVIETTSAFRRKQNIGELTVQNRDNLLVAFLKEATETFTLIPIEGDGFGVAFDLVLEDNLRTLDAIQLGTALDLATPDLELTFVCADQKLGAVATERGLSTIDPTGDG